MRWLIGSLFGTKHNVLDKLLEAGMVMLHLDTRLDGVEVPPSHHGDSHLRLNVSYAFELDHFVVDDNGVQAKLRFGGQRHLCVMPWDAIFAMTSHVEPVGYLWPESLPPEFAHQLGNGEDSAPTPREDGPALRVINGSNNGATTPVKEVAAQPAAASGSGSETASPDTGNPESEADNPEAGQVTESQMKADAAKAGDDDDPDEGGRRYGHLRVVK